MSKQYQIDNHKWLQPDEQAHLLSLLTRLQTSHTRDCLLIELALKSGARASELLAVKKSDFNRTYRSVHIIGLKGSNDRDVSLNPNLFQRLEAYSKDMAPDQLLFPISYDTLTRIWYTYRPVEKTFHSLRHTFAIELLKKTKNVIKVKKALGHKSLTNTMVYLEVEYSAEERMRDAL